MKKISIEGELLQFFLPNEKENRATGKFVLDRNTGVSEISILDFKSENLHFNSIPLLFGVGKDVCYTFVDCLTEELLAFEKTTIKLVPKYVLEGESHAPNTDRPFVKISSKIRNLHQWFVNKDPVVRRDELKTMLNGRFGEVDLLEARVGDIFRCKIRLEPYLEESASDLVYKRDIIFSIEFNNSVNLKEATQVHDEVLSALSVLTYNIVSVDEFEVEALLPDGLNSNYRYHRKLYDVSDSEQLSDYYISYQSIKDDFSRYLNEWYSQKGLLQPVYNSVIESLKSTTSSATEFLVLNVLFGLENLHRRLHDGAAMDESTFKEQLKLAMSSVDNKEFKSLLHNSMSFANKVNFRTRIRFCLNRLPDSLHSRIYDLEKIEYFLSYVCDTRNYLVHFDKRYESRQKAFAPTALIYLFLKLKFILLHNLLLDLGVSKEVLREQYSSHHFSSFTWAIQWNVFEKIYSTYYEEKN